MTLTPLHMREVHTHFRWNNDAELNRFDSEVPFERESLGCFIRRFRRLTRHPQPDARDYEIHLQDGTLIGLAFVDQICLFNRHCRAGVSICERAYRGQGLGREALDLLLHHLFIDLKMHRVTAHAYAFHEAWTGLLRSLGFRNEGVQRDYLFRDGRYWNREAYVLLDEEYRSFCDDRPYALGVARSNGTATSVATRF